MDDVVSTTRAMTVCCMPFGKYQGVALGDILEINPGYLRWLSNQNGFNKPFFEEKYPWLHDERKSVFSSGPLRGRDSVWSSCRGNHLGQRSCASAPTGRTYGRKRSDQSTAQHLARRGRSTYGKLGRISEAAPTVFSIENAHSETYLLAAMAPDEVHECPTIPKKSLPTRRKETSSQELVRLQ